MPIILQVFICTLAGGLLSLIGGIILLAHKNRVKLSQYATAFAAGALLTSALIDMLPEAIEDSDPHLVTTFVLIGLVFFFLLELFISWFHHHSSRPGTPPIDPVVPMVILGDIVHNFLDGIAIAAGFLVSPASGIVVTLVVAAHEIPQEVGDFGLLLNYGIARKKILTINVLTTLATVISAVGFFILGDQINISLGPLLGLVAGFFIYIASSDIIPSIHSSKSRPTKVKQTLTLLTGILIVSLIITSLRHLIH